MEKQYTAMLFSHWFAVREKVSKGVTINSLDLSHNLKLKNLSITSTPNLKHLDVSMLTELNAGGMSINLFEYLTTFVGNGLVFPSSIWYEDPDYREETLVRSAQDGTILERFSGDIRIMPNRERWLIK